MSLICFSCALVALSVSVQLQVVTLLALQTEDVDVIWNGSMVNQPMVEQELVGQSSLDRLSALRVLKLECQSDDVFLIDPTVMMALNVPANRVVV